MTLLLDEIETAETVRVICAPVKRKQRHPSEMATHEVESEWARRLSDPRKMNYQETKAWIAALARVTSPR